MENPYQPYIEALIFTSAQSIRLEEIMYALQLHFEKDVAAEEVLKVISVLQQSYEVSNSALQLVKINSGYQFLTKKMYHEIVQIHQANKAQKKLSTSALETLAIIAYRQPVTKLEIEQIRRVNCDYAVQKLLDKSLISIAGKAETVGKPILYKTSEVFMDYFGINSISELPQMKDIIKEENTIGEIEA